MAESKLNKPKLKTSNLLLTGSSATSGHLLGGSHQSSALSNQLLSSSLLSGSAVKAKSGDVKVPGQKKKDSRKPHPYTPHPGGQLLSTQQESSLLKRTHGETTQASLHKRNVLTGLSNLTSMLTAKPCSASSALTAKPHSQAPSSLSAGQTMLGSSHTNRTASSGLTLGGSFSGSLSLRSGPSGLLSTGLKSGGLTSSLLTSSSTTRNICGAGSLQTSTRLQSRITSSTPKTSRQSSINTKEKRKRKGPGPVKTSQSLHREPEFEIPDYKFGRQESQDENEDPSRRAKRPRFLPPDQDPELTKMTRPIHDVQTMKATLINAVSASLIKSPDFKDRSDGVRLELISMADSVAVYDAEFILKLALYCRNELNIRTSANFLLAYAASNKGCRIYIGKYFNTSIRLPSDWIDVAEQYQIFGDKTLTLGSLPSALRRAMVAKFPDFDKYQLAKYNKESSVKKKRKKAKMEESGGADGRGRGRGRGRGGHIRGGFRGRGAVRGQGPMRGRGAMRGRGTGRPAGSYGLFSSDSESESDVEDAEDTIKTLAHQSSVIRDDSDSEEEVRRLSFTLKQLIRKLHICEPVEHVMCLIGKRYPSSLEDFYKSRLPGTWDEQRAGKRMKLPTPETWETQVSLKGNKASTWEQLIDHKKLPYMAMLRNLRNMIQAGISNKHHDWVLKKLKDQGAVINSRQFPFRFFSAYEVLDELEKKYEETQKALVDNAVAETSSMARGRGGRGRGRGHGRGRGRGGTSGGKQKEPKETEYDPRLLTRYRKAVDEALKVATVHNVAPIRGRTVIFCNTSSSMIRPCAARGLGGVGGKRQVLEVGILLGLMCKYSCEDCELNMLTREGHAEVELEKGTILANMSSVLQMVHNRGVPDQTKLPEKYFESLLIDRTQIDNLVILSDGDSRDPMLTGFLQKYRRLVNANLLFVNIDLGGSSTAGFSKNEQHVHENDIFIAGYSDQILRFIAERGSGGQLTHVENIDTAYKLKPVPGLASERENQGHFKVIPRSLSVLDKTQKWRTVRVFISSTFRDMHGERDLLTRFVFPELRAMARKQLINLYEVDLRWGVTEEDTRSNQTLELCLSEVAKSQLFLGILGERYGWMPDKYIVPDTEEFDWVRQYPPGASVTELEIQAAALADPKSAQGKCFFYLRDNAFSSDIPKTFKKDFVSESGTAFERMQKLKQRIKTSGCEVFDRYPCRWGGVNAGRPLVAGLEDFGSRVLNNVWTAIQKYWPEEDAELDELSHETNQHKAFMEAQRELFVGRKNLLQQAIDKLRVMGHGLVVFHGKPGSGKTSFMASLVHQYVESKHCDSGLTVLTHFLGAAPGSTNIVVMLRRLCHEMNRRFNLQTEVPQDFKNLSVKFGEMLKDGSKVCSSPLVLFLDGLDLLTDIHQARQMDWLPTDLPQNSIVVVSVQEDTDVFQALKRRKPEMAQVAGLDLLDKATIVRKRLSAHRKQLDESPFNNQLKLLLGKREANMPLFLTLACEELRVFGSFEKITEKLKSLPHTVPALLQEILARLEEDNSHELVAMTMTLLVCARNGLTESDLHDLLSYHQAVPAPKSVSDITSCCLTPDKMIPKGVFSKLLRGILMFLRHSDSSDVVLTISHGDITHIVRQRYLKTGGSEAEVRLHRLLAGYYMNQADPTNDGMWNGRQTKAFTELSYHLAGGSSYQDLTRVLCNLRFIQTKCELGLAGQLLEDFEAKGGSCRLSERERSRFTQQPSVQQYRSFVSRNLHILSRYPALTYQQAANEPADTQPALDAKNMVTSGQSDGLSMMEWSNRPKGRDPCKQTLTQFTKPVTCVAVSASGQYMVCGTEDCSVRLYDLATSKELKTFTGHSHTVTSVSFAGNNRMVSASTDKTLSLWDVNSGHRIAVLTGHNRRVQGCATDPAGKLVVSVGWDSSIKVWNAQNGKFMCDLRGNQKPLNAVSIHPEGQLIVTGGWDATLKIWDTFNKTRKAILRGHSSSVRAVAYSPTGQHIVSAALDGEVKLWSATNGSQVGNLRGHSMPINQLIFSPSGQEIITVADDHKVKVWSGHLGKPVSHLGKEDHGPVMSVSVHPDGHQVAAGYHEGHVRVFDIQTGLEVGCQCHHTASVRCLQYSPDGEQLLSGSDDTKVMLMDKKLKLLHTSPSHKKPVLGLKYGQRYAASASEDFTANVYELLKRNDRTVELDRLSQLVGHTGPVTSCSFNEDETRLVTASRDASLMIWDLTGLSDISAQPLQVLHACHSDWINSCAWSNTGDFIVTASNDFNLKLWDLKTGNEKVKFTGHVSAINAVAYKYGCIVSCDFDGAMKVWSHKGTEVTTLQGHNKRVNNCDLWVKVKADKDEAEDLADEQMMDWATATVEEEWKTKHEQTKLDKGVKVEEVMVASCSDDGTIRVWRPLEANELSCFLGHSDRVLAAAASSQGVLCTAGQDQTVRMWDLSVKTHSHGNHNAEISMAAFSCNGNIAVTGSRDGMVRVWTQDGEDNGGEMTCVTEFKAHDKAVTGGVFFKSPARQFVTASEDKSLHVWSIMTDPVVAKHLRRQELKSPCSDVSMDTESSIIVASHWNGTVTIWNYRTGARQTVNMGPTRDWLLSVVLVPSEVTEQKLTILTAAGQSLLINHMVKQTGLYKTSAPAGVPSALNITYPQDVDTPPNKRECRWLHTLAVDRTKIFLGDSQGNLVIYSNISSKLILKPTKIHGGAIRALVLHKQLLLTGSADSTIKVWDFSEIKDSGVTDSQLIQIGQYHTTGPVSSLACCGGGAALRLICGDTRGSVSLLKFHHGQ